jgi:predicted RNA-binding Zn-ribbon protein involved in translation (DUF1610 family)
MKWIIDFCASCGVKLTEGLGLDPDPECPNCGVDVRERDARCQGEFSEEDAKKLMDTE